MSCNGATPDDVKGIIEVDPSVNLTPFLQSARVLAERMVSCATSKGVSISASERVVIETWLAAYFYSARDPRKMSESIGRASVSYQKASGPLNEYASNAIMLDPSGCLKAILSGNRAGGFWLGEEYT